MITSWGGCKTPPTNPIPLKICDQLVRIVGRMGIQLPTGHLKWEPSWVWVVNVKIALQFTKWCQNIKLLMELPPSFLIQANFSTLRYIRNEAIELVEFVSSRNPNHASPIPYNFWLSKSTSRKIIFKKSYCK